MIIASQLIISSAARITVRTYTGQTGICTQWYVVFGASNLVALVIPRNIHVSRSFVSAPEPALEDTVFAISMHNQTKIRMLPASVKMVTIGGPNFNKYTGEGRFNIIELDRNMPEDADASPVFNMKGEVLGVISIPAIPGYQTPKHTVLCGLEVIDQMVTISRKQVPSFNVPHNERELKETFSKLK